MFFNWGSKDGCDFAGDSEYEFLELLGGDIEGRRRHSDRERVSEPFKLLLTYRRPVDASGV